MVIQSVEQDVPTRLPVPGVPEMENDLRTGYYAARVHLYSCTLDCLCTPLQLCPVHLTGFVHLYTCALVYLTGCVHLYSCTPVQYLGTSEAAGWLGLVAVVGVRLSLHAAY